MRGRKEVSDGGVNMKEWFTHAVTERWSREDEVGKYKIETDFASQAGNFKLISEFY